MKPKWLICSALLLNIFFLLIQPWANSLPAFGQDIASLKRASVATDGTQANNNSIALSLSANGRYVAFYSAASNLINGDSNGTDDVFVYDLQTGQINRVSVSTNGNQGNGASYFPSISGDGNYVTFTSDATNFVSGDTNNQPDIFVRDLQTGQTSRVSVASNGTQTNKHSTNPSISGNGRYIVFESYASNLVDGDTNNQSDIFLHDRQTGDTSRVSVATNGTQGNDSSGFSAISGNGNYVVFSSAANNLVSGDTNNQFDIFIHDLQTRETSRISVATNGTQGDNYSSLPSVSGDGRFVTFMSYATNLVSGDTNVRTDAFVHDRQTKQTSRVSIATNGAQGDYDSASDFAGPALSDDGRYVVFTSYATNLVSGDTNNQSDVFLHDRQTGQTSRVSVATNAAQGNNYSSLPSISANGRNVAFTSNASNLVSGDTNGYADVFLASFSQVSENIVLEDFSTEVDPEIKLNPSDDISKIFIYKDRLTISGLSTIPSVWLKITNKSQIPFDPGSGNMGYQVKVILKTNQTELFSRTFSSVADKLMPLGYIEAGKSRPLVGPVSVDLPLESVEGTLEITFIPDPNLGLQRSSVSKPVSIKRTQGGSFEQCLLSSSWEVVKLGLPTPTLDEKIYKTFADILLGCKKGDVLCVTKKVAQALLKIVAGSYSVLIDAFKVVAGQEELYKSLQQQGCIEVSEWLHDVIINNNLRGTTTNGVLTESPVYPLVINASGQRTGFLENGQPVEEIPNSRAVLVGERRLVLYPEQEPVSVQIVGYNAGTMNFSTTFAQGRGSTISLDYINVPVTQGMRATLISNDSERLLKIDLDNDGQVDQARLPDRVEVVNLTQIYLPTVSR